MQRDRLQRARREDHGSCGDRRLAAGLAAGLGRDLPGATVVRSAAVRTGQETGQDKTGQHRTEGPVEGMQSRATV